MFAPGQRVVCVDDSPSIYGDPAGVIRGNIYTIKGPSRFRPDGVLLEELPDPPSPYLGWRAERFRPIRDTDISVFTEMLKTAKKPAEEKV